MSAAPLPPAAGATATVAAPSGSDMLQVRVYIVGCNKATASRQQAHSPQGSWCMRQVEITCIIDGPHPPAPPLLQADAFRRLYPQQYLERFLEKDVRPDGRTLGRSRATSIGLGVVSTADASALVRVGSTKALAGVKCEVMPAPADAPDEGRLAVTVELAPLCSAASRPGRPSEAAAVLSEQLSELLGGTQGILDPRQLCIGAGKAAWQVFLDVYVLDAGEVLVGVPASGPTVAGG